jgi:hypothetical protein
MLLGTKEEASLFLLPLPLSRLRSRKVITVMEVILVRERRRGQKQASLAQRNKRTTEEWEVWKDYSSVIPGANDDGNKVQWFERLHC